MTTISDNTAHITYFDAETQLSFSWDGKASFIEVSHGGYGEPVRNHIPAPELTRLHWITLADMPLQGSPGEWLLQFQHFCTRFVDEWKQWEQDTGDYLPPTYNHDYYARLSGC